MGKYLECDVSVYGGTISAEHFVNFIMPSNEYVLLAGGSYSAIGSLEVGDTNKLGGTSSSQWTLKTNKSVYESLNLTNNLYLPYITSTSLGSSDIITFINSLNSMYLTNYDTFYIMFNDTFNENSTSAFDLIDIDSINVLTSLNLYDKKIKIFLFSDNTTIHDGVIHFYTNNIYSNMDSIKIVKSVCYEMEICLIKNVTSTTPILMCHITALQSTL